LSVLIIIDKTINQIKSCLFLIKAIITSINASADKESGVEYLAKFLIGSKRRINIEMIAAYSILIIFFKAININTTMRVTEIMEGRTVEKLNEKPMIKKA